MTVRQRASQTAFVGGPDDNTTRAEIEGSKGNKARENGGREDARLRNEQNDSIKHLCRGRDMFVRGYCWGFVAKRKGRQPLPEGHHPAGKEGRRARPVPLVWGRVGHAGNQTAACHTVWDALVLSLPCRISIRWVGRQQQWLRQAPKHTARAGGC